MWGFDWYNVGVVSDATMASYQTAGTLGILCKNTSSANIYAMVGSTALVDSGAVINAWNLNLGNVITLDDVTFEILPKSGRSLTALIQGPGPAVYYMESGYKRHVKSDQSFSALGESWSSITYVPDELLNIIVTGAPLGSLTKGSSDAIYLVSNGKKYYVPSYAIMRMWGYTWKTVEPISDSVLDLYPEGGTLNIFAKGMAPLNYAMIGGRAVYINSDETLNHWKSPDLSVTQLDNATFAIYPKSSRNLSRLAKESGPAIYFIENNFKRHLLSWSTYLNYVATYGDYFVIEDEILDAYLNGVAIP